MKCLTAYFNMILNTTASYEYRIHVFTGCYQNTILSVAIREATLVMCLV